QPVRAQSVLLRQQQLHLLSEQPAGADQANAGRRQVTGQQCKLLAVLGLNPHRLDEIDARFATPFLLADVPPALADERPQDFLDRLLLPLLLFESRADGGLVVIAALAEDERVPRQSNDVLPALLIEAR